MEAELAPPTLVQDSRALAELLGALRGAERIAIDTEADSFYSYRDKVCLLQVSAVGRDWLVDPLAGFDLAPLGEMFADERRQKVFHDGEYDILLFKRSFRFEFKNLFDTRVAAAALGSQTPGLASVLREHFGVELDKSMQRSDWRQRPLSEKQVRYARYDTHYLLALMDLQVHELERTGRRMIVDGECARLERLQPPEVVFDPEEFVRLKGARTLAPEERQILRELFIVREGLARESDQPPFRIVNNDVIIAIAQRRPKSLAELSMVPGFSSKQTRKFGDLVLQAIERADQLGPMKRFPELEARDGTGDLAEDEIELHERLKQWRKDAAVPMGNIDSALLLNRHALMRVVQQKPRDLATLAAVDGVHRWQVDHFGAAILDVVKRYLDDKSAGRLPAPRRRRFPR